MGMQMVFALYTAVSEQIEMITSGKLAYAYGADERAAREAEEAEHVSYSCSPTWICSGKM